MIYQLDNILRDVRVCLDQNMSSSTLSLSEDIDTLSLDDIIRSKIVEACRRVETEAPYYLLDGGSNFGDELYWEDSYSGWVLLPPDFMRLVVFEMDDWEQAVYTAISTGSPDYELQRGRVKGLRGTPERPVCALAVRGEGKVLEFYSCKNSDALVSRAVYLPYPSIDADGGIDICERLYEAVVYTAAGLTLLTCGETDKANILSEVAKTFIK